jgi:DNA mismatch repair protein MutL
MSSPDPHIPTARPVIRQLDEAAINRIAAGEVVERPASAVKEMVENAIDAGATRIAVAYADGGKTLIRVTDDGCGMTAEELPLALSRHATSKIDGSDLLNITSFGFRGEALPSLAAVGRLSITSRAQGEPGAQITVTGGRVEPVRPAALGGGTIVELRDIFHATPARLKFMRSDRAEATAIADVLRRLAMAEPSIAFTLSDIGAEKERVVFRSAAAQGELFDALGTRLTQIIGRDFTDNSMRIEATREQITLWGYASLPTFSKGTSVQQYLFVNGRPVRDKLLVGALRGAYADVMARDRHPVAALYVDCPPELVDVNVHPAKTEVRFRDPGIVRGLIVSSIRHALADQGHRSASSVSEGLLGAVRPEAAAPRIYQMDRAAPRYAHPTPAPQMPGFAEDSPAARVVAPAPDTMATELPLGAARAQLHENYIVAQTADGIVIVDQHAAHERLVYEKLKSQFDAKTIARQALLIPQIVELPAEGATRLLEMATELETMGLVIEPFGGNAVAVRETPAILGAVDCEALFADILDALDEDDQSDVLRGRIDAVLSRMSCHGSVRSGRQMRAEEMNALLREMEATPKSGQCNHGRPTYVTLKLSDIERLFGRT